ncbi:RNA polymerase sigma factor [Polaribacter sp.]|uniref:RNA polymerase sigma factor n=1 Tax=Polaribacter sp. TaxID=1920175 RepID=UPI003F6B4734
MKNSNLDKLTDEELITKIVATNSAKIFTILYNRYVKVIYNRCYGFTQNIQEAEDLTHDVFVRLYAKLPTFKGKAKFSTWLYSFTYNFCVNYVQRDNYKKREKVTLNTDLVKEQGWFEEIEDLTKYELRSEKLTKALKLMNPNDKKILLMKYQDNISIKEIQNTLAIGESATKMRIKRAKQKVMSIYTAL